MQPTQLLPTMSSPHPASPQLHTTSYHHSHYPLPTPSPRAQPSMMTNCHTLHGTHATQPLLDFHQHWIPPCPCGLGLHWTPPTTQPSSHHPQALIPNRPPSPSLLALALPLPPVVIGLTGPDTHSALGPQVLAPHAPSRPAITTWKV